MVNEPGSSLARSWLGEDPHIVTWALSIVEIAGAVERRARERLIVPADRRAALRAFDDLAAAWDEVADLLPVRNRAKSLLARYPLRAADAIQLAAGLMAAENDPASLPFACLDRGLAQAAELEGFPVLTWPDPTS